MLIRRKVFAVGDCVAVILCQYNHEYFTMPTNLKIEAVLLGKIGNHTASLTPSEISALSKVFKPVTLRS